MVNRSEIVKNMEPLERLNYDWETILDLIQILRMKQRKCFRDRLKLIIEIQEAALGRNLTILEKASLLASEKQVLLDTFKDHDLGISIPTSLN